jgi:hypothetical protein
MKIPLPSHLNDLGFANSCTAACQLKVLEYQPTIPNFKFLISVGKEGNYKKLKLKPKTIIEIEIPN